MMWRNVIKQLFVMTCVWFGIASTVCLGATFEKTWDVTGFQSPESVIYDAQRDVLYVSNINSGPSGTDRGKGFLSKVKPDGTIETLEWITGLNGPAGMGISGNTLYVADQNRLLEIDVKQGTVAKTYDAPNAILLNDVTLDDQGNVYVSDLFGNAIYRLSQGVFAVWLQDEQLENPNGVLAMGDQLIVASWGKITQGFETSVAGHLRAVALATKAVTDIGNGEPVGNLDGLVSDGQGNYYVTSHMAGTLLNITPAGEVSEVLQLSPGCADLTFIKEKGLLLVPQMYTNQLVGYQVAR